MQEGKNARELTPFVNKGYSAQAPGDKKRHVKTHINHI